MAQDMGQLTDMWMVNPYMFDPTQKSNQFSNYNNAALPWPPTYNTGAGGPVNAATGQPIQSFQDWQKANPGGMSINTTPAAPAAPQQSNIPQYFYYPGGQISGGASARNMGVSVGNVPESWQVNPAYVQQQMQQQRPAPQAAQQPQASGPPNNWQAAINALSNPGKVTTQGATVPQVTGYQPSGGVNNAFLQQAGAGQGMNQNFLSALAAIQARPEQGASGGAAASGAMGGGGMAAPGGGGMPPPSGGVPGTAFSQPLQQGGTGLSFGAGMDQGNRLAGMGNWTNGSGNVPAGGWQGGWQANSGPGQAFANMPAWASAQQRLMGR